MLRDQFPSVDAHEIDGLPEKFRYPFKHNFGAFFVGFVQGLFSMVLTSGARIRPPEGKTLA